MSTITMFIVEMRMIQTRLDELGIVLDVFEDRGIHARSVFGAVSVRDNLPLIIDSIFEVEQ